MRIPKYKKSVNRYAITFLNQFHAQLESLKDTYPLDLKERNTINDVITRYYSMFFTLVHQDNKKLQYHPEYATRFNLLFSVITAEIVRMYYFYSPDEIKNSKITLETMVKRIGYKMYNLINEDLTDEEIVIQLIDYIYDKNKELFKKEYYFNEEYYLSEIQKHRGYHLAGIIREKYYSKLEGIKEKLNSVMNYDINSAKFALIISIIPFCLLFFLPPAMFILASNDIEHFYSIIIGTVFYVTFFSIFGWCMINTWQAKKKLEYLQEFENYYSKFHRLGVDVLSIWVSEELIDYVDAEKKNEFMPAIADLRLNLTDEYGFILPGIRIMDSKDIQGNKFSVRVRNQEVAMIDYHPKNFVIAEEDFKKLDKNLPEDAIESIYDGKKYYWLKEKFFKDIDTELYMTRFDYLKFIMNDISFKYLDKLLSPGYAFLLLELVKDAVSTVEDAYDYDVYSATDFTLVDYKEIFLKILQKGGNLKDIEYVFERIVQYSKKTKDPDLIAFSICQDLKFRN